MTAPVHQGLAAAPPHQVEALATSGESVRRGARSLWREEALTRIGELMAELNRLAGPARSDPLAGDARNWLEEAKQIVERKPGPIRAWFGQDVEAARNRIDAVLVALIRLSPPKTVKAKLARIISYGEQVLPDSDECMKNLHMHADQSELSEDDRESIGEAVKSVCEGCRKQDRRLRSFRNILLGTALFLVLLAVVLGVVGLADPSAMYLGTQTATRWDIFAIELLGLLSASLVGSVAIRQMRGTSTPYGVPMASLLLKLPAGGLTAVAAVLLIRSGIVGREVVGTDGVQLIAYALIFGAAQQTFTRLIDRQAHNVLNAVPTIDRDAAKQPASS
jgi:hypothetical protein